MYPEDVGRYANLYIFANTLCHSRFLNASRADQIRVHLHTDAYPVLTIDTIDDVGGEDITSGIMRIRTY